MINKINLFIFSPIVTQVLNISTMIEDVTLLEDLRQELKIVSSIEYENKFFEEAKKNTYKQPFGKFDFIVSAYREEILKKLKGE